MSRRAWSIRWWLASFAATVSLPLLILLGWIFVSELWRAQAGARTRSLQIARATAKGLRQLNSESLELLDLMAKRPTIRDHDDAPCDSLFSIVDFFPQYSNLFLFDSENRLRCAATPMSREDREVSAGAQPWIDAELRAGRLVPRRPMIRIIGRRWVSVMAVPVTGSDGSPHGMLALVQLPAVAKREALPRNTVVTILDQSGTVVARSADSARWAGRNVRGMGATDLVLLKREGTASATGIDGIERQYGFTYLPEIGWSISVGIPDTTVMRPVRAFYMRAGVAGTAVVLFVIVITLVWSRSIERPINALAGAAESASAGAYERVSTAEGPLEIATLGDAFNKMVDSRSRAEQGMQEGERNLRAISERLLVAQEEERRRIAREIHDDLGQSLTALKMDIGGLLSMTPQSPATAAIRARIVGTLDGTVTAVQRISAELRPSMLDDLGLIAALETEALLFEQRTGIECDLSLPDELPDVNLMCATAIYRIVQESLTNVARHSNASRVELRLRERGEELLLEVRDDGRGLTPEEATSPSSFGLIGIRERAELLGAVVHFEGIRGRGTIVSLRIPTARMRP
ncbi:MAG TPA: histidine kinase [Thermoanaerobaculia bacterium]|nr:histidine kinase [Thermoanaerobaculia bacterium]